MIGKIYNEYAKDLVQAAVAHQKEEDVEKTIEIKEHDFTRLIAAMEKLTEEVGKLIQMQANPLHMFNQTRSGYTYPATLPTVWPYHGGTCALNPTVAPNNPYQYTTTISLHGQATCGGQGVAQNSQGNNSGPSS